MAARPDMPGRVPRPAGTWLDWSAPPAGPTRPARLLIFEDGVIKAEAGPRLVGRDRVVRRLLLSARIRPGDRVAVMMPNRAEFMVTWLAVAACRGILVALNPAARSHDALPCAGADLAARVAVVDGAQRRLVAVRSSPNSPELAGDHRGGRLRARWPEAHTPGTGLPDRPDKPPAPTSPTSSTPPAQPGRRRAARSGTTTGSGSPT